VTTIPAQYHIETAPLLFGQGMAVFSLDRTYRYRLDRAWGDGPRVLWVMLNPSTADAFVEDPTVKRCMSFTRAWGYKGLTVVNLFAMRSPYPADLLHHDDPVGPGNDDFIAVQALQAAVVVAAWGAHRFAGQRGTEVMKILGSRAKCLGITKDGLPRHPLYVKGGTELVPYSPGR
jgi:hypothetical protein